MAPGAPTISVVLATYNGQRYLADQVLSITRQSRPPDELLLCDDASTDQTVAVASELLTAARIPFRVLTTPSNLGVTANFSRGIEAASGDVIVLADQDDVWRSDKLSELARHFSAQQSPLAVFTDAELIDGSGAAVGSTLWSRAGLDRPRLAAMREGRVLPVLMHKNFVTGATLAFDARLRPAILPLSTKGLHDHWIAVVAAALGRLRPIQTPLMAYRIHAGNTVGLPGGSLSTQLRARSSLGDVRCSEIGFHEDLLARIRTLDSVPPGAVATLEGKLRHLHFRQALPSGRLHRSVMVGRGVLAGEYGRYSRGLRSAVYDVVV